MILFATFLVAASALHSARRLTLSHVALAASEVEAERWPGQEQQGKWPATGGRAARAHDNPCNCCFEGTGDGDCKWPWTDCDDNNAANNNACGKWDFTWNIKGSSSWNPWTIGLCEHGTGFLYIHRDSIWCTRTQNVSLLGGSELWGVTTLAHNQDCDCVAAPNFLWMGKNGSDECCNCCDGGATNGGCWGGTGSLSLYSPYTAKRYGNSDSSTFVKMLHSLFCGIYNGWMNGGHCFCFDLLAPGMHLDVETNKVSNDCYCSCFEFNDPCKKTVHDFYPAMPGVEQGFFERGASRYTGVIDACKIASVGIVCCREPGGGYSYVKDHVTVLLNWRGSAGSDVDESRWFLCLRNVDGDAGGCYNFFTFGFGPLSFLHFDGVWGTVGMGSGEWEHNAVLSNGSTRQEACWGWCVPFSDGPTLNPRFGLVRCPGAFDWGSYMRIRRQDLGQASNGNVRAWKSHWGSEGDNHICGWGGESGQINHCCNWMRFFDASHDDVPAQPGEWFEVCCTNQGNEDNVRNMLEEQFGAYDGDGAWKSDCKWWECDIADDSGSGSGGGSLVETAPRCCNCCGDGPNAGCECGTGNKKTCCDCCYSDDSGSGSGGGSSSSSGTDCCNSSGCSVGCCSSDSNGSDCMPCSDDRGCCATGGASDCGSDCCSGNCGGAGAKGEKCCACCGGGCACSDGCCQCCVAESGSQGTDCCSSDDDSASTNGNNPMLFDGLCNSCHNDQGQPICTGCRSPLACRLFGPECHTPFGFLNWGRCFGTDFMNDRFMGSDCLLCFTSGQLMNGGSMMMKNGYGPNSSGNQYMAGRAHPTDPLQRGAAQDGKSGGNANGIADYNSYSGGDRSDNTKNGGNKWSNWDHVRVFLARLPCVAMSTGGAAAMAVSPGRAMAFIRSFGLAFGWWFFFQQFPTLLYAY